MNQLYIFLLFSLSFAQLQNVNNEFKRNKNSGRFDNILQIIKFTNNRFLFLTDNQKIFEINYKEYNENDFRFKFNESSITLIKDSDKPSPLNIPLQYTSFFNNNFFFIVDKSFSSNNEFVDITFDTEYVRFLTYSTAIPFKFSPKLKMIQIDVGSYSGIHEIDFTSPLEVQKNSILTLSTFSVQTDRHLSDSSNYVIFDKVFLNDNSILVSDSEHFLFPQIQIVRNGAVKFEGVKSSGDVYIEGAKTIVNIVSNPLKAHSSNFGKSRFNLKISDDLYTIHNSPQNSPLLNFDTSSIENSINSIKVNFENYNRSLFHSKYAESVKLLTLLAVDDQKDSFQCQKFADLVSFEPRALPLSTENAEVVEFSALCKNGKVEVHCQLQNDEYESESPSASSDESGGGHGSDDDNEGNKKKSMIALICAFGSAAIIVIVAVSVSCYLKKHYKEGDSDKAQMMIQLNQDGTPDATI